MSRKDTEIALGLLNSGLQSRYEEGEAIRLDVYGRPKFRVLSFDPLAYEMYGTLRNRAPFVAGSLALRAFISAPHPDGGELIIAGVEADRGSYGFILDGSNAGIRETVNEVASLLGHPDLQFLPD